LLQPLGMLVKQHQAVAAIDLLVGEKHARRRQRGDEIRIATRAGTVEAVPGGAPPPRRGAPPPPPPPPPPAVLPPEVPPPLVARRTSVEAVEPLTLAFRAHLERLVP